MKPNDALTLTLAMLCSALLHVFLISSFFHVHFRPIQELERQVRKHFNLKEVEIRSLKTHVEALPVPSTRTFRHEQTVAFGPPSGEVEGVRQSMQTLQLEPNPPGTPLLPQGAEPSIRLTSPDQPVVVSDTHEKIRQEIIAVQEAKLKERAYAVEAAPRGQAQADIVERAGKQDRRLPEELGETPGALTGGEGDPLETSLRAAAAGIGLKESALLTRMPSASLPKTADQPYESIEPWLNVEIFTHVDAVRHGNPGFFHVRITTKPNHPLRVIPKDIVFVLDASASITQERLDRFGQAVTRVLELLHPMDRFTIVKFSDKPSYLRQGMLPASARNQHEVRVLLGTLRSHGATDLYGALAPLMALEPSPGRLLLLCLLSDGKPTAGLVDAAEIINRISSINNHRATILAFGGPTSNQYLLDLLSFRNRGRSAFASRLADMEQAFVSLYAEVRNPILMDLQFQFAGLDTTQVFPQVLPHLYQDSSLDLYGRYDPATQKTFAFRLVGETYAEKKELFVSRDLPPPDPARKDLPTQWARNKIYHLIGELVRQDSPERRREILKLGADYQIQVPYLRASRAEAK